MSLVRIDQILAPNSCPYLKESKHTQHTFIVCMLCTLKIVRGFFAMGHFAVQKKVSFG